MPTYITTDEDGKITSSAQWQFPESVETDREVVRGYDGGLYFKGEEPQPPEPSEDELFASLRAIRNAKLIETDIYMIADFPISEEQKAAIIKYRQELRDITTKVGAPWDGGFGDTPWPSLQLQSEEKA